MTPIDPQDRLVRIFISSPFRGMERERALLINQTFPRIRRKCQELGVELVPIDLRWGITDEQAESDATLVRCLEEIDRSRNSACFFVGLLGHYYGAQVRHSHFAAAMEIPRYHPLRPFSDRSYTELEIRYGLSIHAAEWPQGALLYFRDAALSATLDDGEPDSRAEALRLELNASHPNLIHTYKQLEHLDDQVEKDVLSRVTTCFAKQTPLDTHQAARQLHTRLAAARTRSFFPDRKMLDTLSQCAASSSTVVVTGERGTGKATLISHWLNAVSSHTTVSAFEYFVGESTSCDFSAFATQLIEDIRRRFAIADSVLLSSLNDVTISDWLHRVPDNHTLTIAVYNADRFKSEFAPLAWIPDVCPYNVRFLVSVSEHSYITVATNRGWTVCEITQFHDLQRRSSFVQYLLASHGKSATESQIATVLSCPLANTPMFLKLIIQELSFSGSRDEVFRAITTYATFYDLASLCDNILDRLEEALSKALVRESLTLLHLSRRGLSEVELRELTGSTALAISTLLGAISEFVVQTNGMICLSEDSLRAAINTRYASDNEQELRRRIISYMSNGQSIDPARRTFEVPFQFVELEDSVSLLAFLATPEHLFALAVHHLGDVYGYWQCTGVPLHETASHLRPLVRQALRWKVPPGIPAKDISGFTFALAQTLFTLHCPRDSLVLTNALRALSLVGGIALAFDRLWPGRSKTASDRRRNLAYNELIVTELQARILDKLGHYAAAERRRRKVIRRFPTMFSAGQHGDELLLRILQEMAFCLRRGKSLIDQGYFWKPTAGQNLRAAMDVAATVFPQLRDLRQELCNEWSHLAVRRLVRKHGQLRRIAGDDADSVRQCQEQVQDSATSPSVSAAEVLRTEMLKLPQSIRSNPQLASLLDEAVLYQGIAWNTSLELYGRNCTSTARCLVNLSALAIFCGDGEAAENHMLQACDIYVRLFGDNHPSVAKTLSDAAQLMTFLGKTDRALEFSERAVAIARQFTEGEMEKDAQSSAALASFFGGNASEAASHAVRGGRGKGARSLNYAIRMVAWIDRWYAFTKWITARRPVSFALSIKWLRNLSSWLSRLKAPIGWLLSALVLVCVLVALPAIIAIPAFAALASLGLISSGYSGLALWAALSAALLGTIRAAHQRGDPLSLTIVRKVGSAGKYSIRGWMSGLICGLAFGWTIDTWFQALLLSLPMLIGVELLGGMFSVVRRIGVGIRAGQLLVQGDRLACQEAWLPAISAYSRAIILANLKFRPDTLRAVLFGRIALCWLALGFPARFRSVVDWLRKTEPTLLRLSASILFVPEAGRDFSTVIECGRDGSGDEVFLSRTLRGLEALRSHRYREAVEKLQDVVSLKGCNSGLTCQHDDKGELTRAQWCASLLGSIAGWTIVRTYITLRLLWHRLTGTAWLQCGQFEPLARAALLQACESVGGDAGTLRADVEADLATLRQHPSPSLWTRRFLLERMLRVVDQSSSSQKHADTVEKAT